MLAQEERGSLAAFSRRVLIVALAVVGLWIAWQTTTLLILAFGGILLAVILHRAAAWTSGKTHLGRRWALLLVLVVLAALLAGGAVLFGSQVIGQFRDLQQTVSQGVEQIMGWAQSAGLTSAAAGGSAAAGEGGGGAGLETLLSGSMVSRAFNVATVAVDALAGVLIVVFIGLYLAATPDVYRRGLILLFPSERHDAIAHTLDETGEALWRWMIGQFISMLVIGVTTTIVLTIMGVPMAFALGLIAGILEFIPILGPWLSAVPAVLVGLTVDVRTAAMVAVAYFMIQQVESYIVTPMAERWAVALPPALTVAAATAFTLMFGFVGLLFATPFTLAVIVIVRVLYVRGALHNAPKEETRMPG